MTPPSAAETYGILAGNGSYPTALAHEIISEKHELVVAGLKGHFLGPPPPGCAAFGRVPVGALGEAARFFLDRGASKIFFAGGVSRGAAWRGARPDRHALSLLPRLLRPRDDALLRAVARSFGELGVQVCDPAPFIGDLLARRGLIAGPEPTEETARDISIALDAARELGARDAGQAAIVYRGEIAGVEGSAGTDALIASAPGPGAVLAKVVKPGQDRRFDLPAIGPATALIGRAVGLEAIAVEAGGVLLLGREQLAGICRRSPIALVGVPGAGEI